MIKDKNKRDIKITIRFTTAEINTIDQLWKQSQPGKKSEFLRRRLLDKPIIMLTRNRSLDDFMAEMIALRNELNAIGKNYNQSVKKMHSLYHLPEVRDWQAEHRNIMSTILEKTAQIKTKINQINDQWLRS